MIRRLRVQNFRCLRDVEIELGTLTVFVGPNGCGKTAIADVLTPPRALCQADFWRKDAPWVDLTGKYFDGTRINGRWALPEGDLHISGLRSRRQRLRPETIKQHNQVQEATELDSEGSNLVNAFATLSRKQQESFVAEFCALVPYYSDVQARPSAPGQHRLVFQDRWEKSLRFEPNEVSDGTLLAFAFLFLARHQPNAELLVMEDPDHGLHPYLVGEVVALLRKLANGELGGRAIQVVLTTHSASLLNHLEPAEVRFLTRDLKTGEARVAPAPVDKADWAVVYDEYQRSLGNLWLSGAMGGVPGA